MPNLPILGIGLAIVLMLSHHSSKANEEKSRQQIAAMPNKPEHAPIDNSVSGGTMLFCFVIVIVFVFLSMPR